MENGFGEANSRCQSGIDVKKVIITEKTSYLNTRQLDVQIYKTLGMLFA
jgi:hypothetical protein